VSKATASTIVLVTGAALIVYALLDARNGNATSEQTYKRIYSSFLATVGLGVFADFVPQLVGPFSILVLLAAWANHKGVLGGIIGGASTPAVSGAAAAHAGGTNPQGGPSRG